MTRAALIAGALAMVASGADASTGCNAINALGTQVNGPGVVTLTGAAVTLDAGDRVTITNGPPFFDGAQTFAFSAPLSFTVGGNQTQSVTIAASGTFTITRTSTGGGASASTMIYACVNATGGGSESTNGTTQNLNNAQTATQNGQQTLQTFNDWVTKAVNPGLSGGGAGGGATLPATLAPPTAQARLRRLELEESELAFEATAQPTQQGEQRLAAARRDLMYARATVLSQSGTRPDTAGVFDGETARRPPAPGSSFGLTARDFDACDGETVCAPPDRRWNVWLEGKVIGVVDSLAQTNSTGFVGGVGADYQVEPWTVVGLSVGTETFETRMGGAGLRSGTIGLTIMPYLGVRVHENVIVSGFVGLTTINYNNNPATAVTARFQATRFFFGGALTGIWRTGPWRFQPALTGTWANEYQHAYADSVGTNVPSQTVTYSRLTLGPEIGYTFVGASWSIEPYALAKVQLDFNSSNIAAVNNQAIVLRAGTQGSGTLGAGVEMRFDGGFSLRLQASYDSIGVQGLDIWSGLIRGGFRF